VKSLASIPDFAEVSRQRVETKTHDVGEAVISDDVMAAQVVESIPLSAGTTLQKYEVPMDFVASFEYSINFELGLVSAHQADGLMGPCVQVLIVERSFSFHRSAIATPCARIEFDRSEDSER
jgi:hypothetical protein